MLIQVYMYISISINILILVRAEYFYVQHIIHRIEEFKLKMDKARDNTEQLDSKLLLDRIRTEFPFTDFFAYAPQPLFKVIYIIYLHVIIDKIFNAFIASSLKYREINLMKIWNQQIVTLNIFMIYLTN